MTEFTQMVLRYQKLATAPSMEHTKETSSLLQEIIGRSTLIIYRYPVHIHLLDEESAADLLLMIRPRLQHIIETFTYEGMPFENFIRRISYMQAKHLAKRKAREMRHHMCITLPSESFDLLAVGDHAVPYCASRDDPFESACTWDSETKAGRLLKRKIASSKYFKRRFLQLVLLCSEELDAHKIKFLATFMGMDEHELAQKICIAYEKSRGKRERLEHLFMVKARHYLDKQFYARELEILKSYHADPVTVERVNLRYEREKRYFQQKTEQLCSRCHAVTHDVVGELTGVPKGTVDSGISALKKYLIELMDDCG
jgi:hypothetical protein